MATITEAAKATSQWTVAPDEQRIVLRGISWATYKKIQEELGDAHILKAYNRGELELMSPGYNHEDYKVRLRRLVEVLTEEMDIPCKGLASTTWDDDAAEKGVEPDECFLLTPPKLAAIHPRPKSAADCPRPDLAIEVGMRRSAVNRAEIYATLGVPEVWRFDGETLRIDRLRDDRSYEPANASAFLPITPADIVRWVLIDEPGDDHAWVRRFRAWVRAGLPPDQGGNG